jgi:hypothetical protein
MDLNPQDQTRLHQVHQIFSPSAFVHVGLRRRQRGGMGRGANHETTRTSVSSGVVVGKLLLSIIFEMSGSSEIATENEVPLHGVLIIILQS